MLLGPLWRDAQVAKSYMVWFLVLCTVTPWVVVELAAEEALQLLAPRLPPMPPGNALRSRWFHQPGGGTFRTAPFRIPGNKQWPAPLDDLHNSFSTTFFHSQFPVRRLLLHACCSPPPD